MFRFEVIMTRRSTPRFPWTLAGLLLLAAVLLLGACAPKRVYRQPGVDPADGVESGSSPTSPVPRTAPSRSPLEPREPAETLQVAVQAASLARDQVGRPYRWGGTDPARGFDCSGLVQWSYGCVGINLPRVVRDQRRRGEPVQGDQLQIGDLVFFSMRGDRVSHVGLYLGDGKFVHAPSSGNPVRTDSLDDPYWRQRWQGSRRVAAER
jgi:cell wall-associated NlpC family hydrolase